MKACTSSPCTVTAAHLVLSASRTCTRGGITIVSALISGSTFFPQTLCKLRGLRFMANELHDRLARTRNQPAVGATLFYAFQGHVLTYDHEELGESEVLEL